MAKLNASGNALVYSTYLGGSGTDQGRGIAVDPSGNAYVMGETRSSNFPTVSPLQAATSGPRSAFISKIMDLTPGPPVVPPNSVVNGASFRPATDPNGAIAPGAIVSIFGTDLAGTTEEALAVPLPTTLGDTSVTFNGTEAPLFAISGGQINAQAPFEVLPGEVSVQIKRGSETSAAQTVSVAAVSPGIFALSEDGNRPRRRLDREYSDHRSAHRQHPGRETRPANRLEFISIFAAGLGDVTNRPPNGEPPSGSKLSHTLETSSVTIGGVPVPPSFSGLPSFVGLYQVDVQVPSEAPTGDAVEIVLTIGGVTSNTVTIAVQ